MLILFNICDIRIINLERGSLIISYRKNIILLICWLFLIISCSISVNPPMYIDETDSDNPYYIEPGVTVYSQFTIGDTLTENEFIITWQGSVLDSCEFTWTIDSIIFSDWSVDTMIYIPPLDEGWHTFAIRARYLNGVEQEFNYAFPFYIDAIQGQSLRFSPPYQKIAAEVACDIDIWLEEVDNWSGGRITLVWDGSQAYISNYQLHDQIYDFLMQNNSSLVSRVDQYADSLVIDLGLVDDLPIGISGSGSVVTVTFQSINSIDTLELGFGSSCDFVDAANQSIPITELAGAVVLYE